MSCSRCWVKTRGLCDLCSSPPRCLKDSETPACMGVYISLMMEGEKESSELLYFFVFPFLLPKFKKVSHRRLLCISQEHSALVFPVADELQLSCQSHGAATARQCRGDLALGSLYTSVNRTEEISFT